MRVVLTSLGISIAVAAIVGVAGVWAVQDELAKRPPIAIVDYGPIVNALDAGEQPSAIEPYLLAIKRRSAAYEKAGYVVINAASVDAAPNDVYVPPPDDLPQAWKNIQASDAKIPENAPVSGKGAQ